MSEPRSTWVPGAEGSGFGVENLPYGVLRARGGEPRPAVRIGDFALDLSHLATAGALATTGVSAEVLSAPTLNPLLEQGPEAWSALRSRLQALLASRDPDERDTASGALVPLSDCEPSLPVQVGDYVDFFSSIEHATNAGRIFRPAGEPLAPNWRHLPVGYHGRAGTIVVSETPVRRPCGQRAPAESGAPPTFGPERWLDAELELGFVTGPGPPLGIPIPAADAGRYIFGFVLVADWSAREIQRWESQPLGPFLGKSFATSIGAWIVPLDALAPLRVPNVPQEPPPLEHLRVSADWALDVDFELALLAGGSETVLSRVNSRGLYWNAAQQLAHATSGGASVRAGDLFASGTISGSDPGTYGCLLELSWGGQQPVELSDGGRRTFLEDGDTVVMRGAGTRAGSRISFGELRGKVLASLQTHC